MFRSRRCDCGSQLEASIEHIVRVGVGVIVYLTGHEGRGIGLGRKLQAYRAQDRDNLDTVDANTAIGCPVDSRDYTSAADILTQLCVNSVALMTNNPDKVAQLADHGIKIDSVIPLETPPTADNLRYLTAKRDRLGHTFAF